MEIEKITTAVIPAGGWGTRFLPSTKSIPKEMFPLGSKPIILHVVEELVASGITNIIFVVSHHKQSIESFFAPNELVEGYITKVDGQAKGEALKAISKLATFDFVYAQASMGNGWPLQAVRHLLEDKSFVLTWSDEIIISKIKPRVAQCLDTYYKYGKPVISAVKIEDATKRSKYGMAELTDMADETEIKEIVKIVEKPAAGQEPSAYATHGAYVLTPDVFKALDRLNPIENSQLGITDIINEMKKETGLLGKIISDGHYLDCGDPLSYLLSQVDYFINYSEFAEEALMALSTPVCRR
jgi:UTP--glucose-1-phosphate uridylyltransferase